jgi:hypothetical protein
LFECFECIRHKFSSYMVRLQDSIIDQGRWLNLIHRVHGFMYTRDTADWAELVPPRGFAGPYYDLPFKHE